MGIYTEPHSCRHCGIPKRDHFRRWTPEAGWHAWTAPDDDLILSRMTNRRRHRMFAATRPSQIFRNAPAERRHNRRKDGA